MRYQDSVAVYIMVEVGSYDGSWSPKTELLDIKCHLMQEEA